MNNNNSGNNKLYRSHVNYFKRTNLLKYIGLGLLALSALLFFFYISYALMCLSFVTGLALLFLNSFDRADESDIDVYIRSKMHGLAAKPKNEKLFARRQRKELAVFECEGHVVLDGLMLKRSKDGTLRTSKFTKYLIYPLDTAILICYRTVSVISDEVKEGELELLYKDITAFQSVTEELRLTFSKKEFEVKRSTLRIESLTAPPIELPVQISTATDTFVDKINALITKTRVEEEKKAGEELGKDPL